MSQHAEIQPLLINAADAAKLAGVSRAHWCRLRSAGKIPDPHCTLGRRVLWLRSEIESWIANACPPRDVWQEMKSSQERRLRAI